MNTCERDATGIAGYLNRLTGGMFSSRTINGAVHHTLPRPAEDFLDSPLRGSITTSAPKKQANSRRCAGGSTAQIRRRLSRSRCGDRQKPDWSAPMDRYRFARVGSESQADESAGQSPEARPVRLRRTTFRRGWDES